MQKAKSNLLIILIVCSAALTGQSLTKYTLTSTYTNATTPIDKYKVLNVARGGQGISGDLKWMPKFYTKLNEIGIDEFRVDWLLSNRFYNVVTRNTSGQLVYNFSNLDKTLVPMAQKGIKPLMCMTYMATPLGKDSFPPTNYTEYAEVIRRYVQYYKDLGYTGWAWESHNEPEGFTKLTPQQTYQMYKVFSEAVKSVDPTARVGGFGAVGLDWIGYIRSFLDYYKADASKPAMDFFSFHQYGHDGWHYVPTIESAFTTRGLPVPALYITEWNNHWGTAPGQGNYGKAGPGNSFDTNKNASYLAKKMFQAYSYPNVKKIYYFNFADTDKSRLYTGDMGIFTYDGYHRKSGANTFWFYSRMHSHLLPSYVSGVGSNRDTYGFMTVNKDSSLLSVIAWNYQNKAVEFNTSCTKLPTLPQNMEYVIEKYLIDSTNGNHYYDFVNGSRSFVRTQNEYAQVVKTSKLTTNNLLINDTLNSYSVVQYMIRPVLSTTSLPTPEATISTFSVTPGCVENTAHIQLSLKKQTYVKLAVYDPSGASRLLIDEGIKNENQLYNIRFDASGLPKGVYFVTLLTQNQAIKTTRFIKL